jgi:hypothetical protein
VRKDGGWQEANTGPEPTGTRDVCAAGVRQGGGVSDWWTPTTVRGWSGQSISNRFESIQIFLKFSNFDRFKKDFFGLKIFEIKYGFEGFKERNKFFHRNFLRFKVHFE